MPERHTLLMVLAGTVIGMPAFAAAWRAVIWPWPACSTWPIKHVVDLLGADTGALERGLDREPAEVGGAESREGAGELPDRRACRSDDHRSGHECLLNDLPTTVANDLWNVRSVSV